MASRALRFRILQRDNFTCQYCGRKAPDVVLEVDHVDPRAHGGRDSVRNLITACYDCNQGKRDSLLSPEQVAAFSNRPTVTPVVPRVRRRVVPSAPRFIPEPKRRCTVCGMIDDYEGDGCGCPSRSTSAREVYWCGRCGDREVDEECAYCEDCYWEVYCPECGVCLEDEEHEADCAVGQEVGVDD